MSSLSHLIRSAITSHNTAELYRLKDICDRLHNGVPSYLDYTADDLPNDTLYEELNRTIKSSQAGIPILTSRGMQHNTIIKDGKQINNKAYLRDNLLPDLWMGSIPKQQSIVSFDNAIMMPKFDGCSCGVKYSRCIDLKPTKATTRGTDAAFRKQTSNILEKYISISKPITEALNSSAALMFEFNKQDSSNGTNDTNELGSSNDMTKSIKNKLTKPNNTSNSSNQSIDIDNINNFNIVDEGVLPFSYATSINIRGEIVLTNKTLTTSPPAAYVAGKLNGGMDVWNKAVNTMQFLPYEIMKITFSVPDKLVRSKHSNSTNSSNFEHEVVYIPSQDETVKFFQACNLMNYSVKYTTLNTSNNMSIVQDYYKSLLSALPEPIDGVVYTSTYWQYPQTRDAKTSTNYNKYAWKPSSEGTSILRSVDYSISRDGKLGLILNYDPININGKTYTKAKTAPTRMTNALDGIKIGSIITVELCNDISPQVKDFDNETLDNDEQIEPYTLPKTCPFCGSKVNITNRKATTIAQCTNKQCTEIMVQKYKNFLSILNIKGVAEGKLRKLAKTDELNLFDIHDKLMTSDILIESIEQLTFSKFMGAIGFGTNRKISMFCDNNKVSGLSMIMDVISKNKLVIDNVKEQMKDAFVDDVIEFVREI